MQKAVEPGTSVDADVAHNVASKTMEKLCSLL